MRSCFAFYSEIRGMPLLCFVLSLNSLDQFEFSSILLLILAYILVPEFVTWGLMKVNDVIGGV